MVQIIRIAVLLLFVCALATISGLAAEIRVNVVQINPSEILTEEDILAITSQIEGQTVKLDDLQSVVDQINTLYVQKNYVTAKAILVSQQFEDGVVRIQLVEGRIGEILVQNNDSTRDVYVTERLSLKPGDLVRLDVLEQDITYFNETNDIQLAAQLQAGKDFGETDCVLNVSEPPRNPASFFVDNGGRTETGLYRVGLSVAEKSLLGIRDTLTLNGVFSTGAVNVSTGYERPVGTHGSSLSVSYGHSETNIVGGAFESAKITGFSSTWGIKYNHPFEIQPQVKRYASVEWSSNQADNYFSGVNLISSKYQKMTLSTAAQSSGKDWNLYLQQDITAGFVEASEKKEFLKYSGSATMQRLVSQGYIFTFQGAYQLTPDKLLPSSEEFSIGGMGTVRGYPEGKLAGDNGYFISFELSEQVSARATGAIFIDHGGAFPFKGNDEPVTREDYATSVGLSAVIGFTERITGKFALGFPLLFDGPPRLHFLVQTSL